MFAAVNRALSHIRVLLASIVRDFNNVVAFLADLFCAEAIPVAAKLGVPAYTLFLSNLMALSLLLRLPELDKTTTCEYHDLPEPVQLPGSLPMRGADLLDTIQDRTNLAYGLVVELLGGTSSSLKVSS
ncbi:hypothetical protein PR202_ga10470 [Eleusine coracana subsp. coracana]|uniref:Uncharacterized protein n=1 Tax=Eleusine coracana subsp. coracana TaxID=191504 RepID=A0AAV5C6S4_ELECO|nr:hypothetical protein PR202_ga10470 [Eleusine coracana subsp. coracana]